MVALHGASQNPLSPNQRGNFDRRSANGRSLSMGIQGCALHNAIAILLLRREA